MSTRVRGIFPFFVVVAMLWTTISAAYGREAGAAGSPTGAKKAEQSHWASETIQTWLDYGLVKGYADGSFKPNQPIIRAEFIALLNRVFKYAEAPEVLMADVPSGAWYRDDLLKAVGAGILQGDGKGYYRPMSPISRQEAAVVLAKAYEAEASDKEAYRQFKDAGSIAGWAAEAISALTERKAISGMPSGDFAPNRPLTRAEALTMADRLMGRLLQSSGSYSEDANGNLVVNAAGVTLRDMTVTGDLYLAPGIGNGDVTLDGVTVKGNVYVNGGGDIRLIHSILAALVVNKRDQKIRIVAEGGSVIGITRLFSGAKLEGNFEYITVEGSGLSVQLLGGIIGKLVILKGGASARINLGTGVKITSFRADAKAAVTGEGTIAEAWIYANGVTFGKAPDKIFVANGVVFGEGGSAPGAGNGTGTNPGTDPGTGPGNPSGQERVSAIVFGQPADEQAVNLTVLGSSGSDAIDTKVGELTNTYPVRYMEGKQAEISFELDNPVPGQALTLELEEIHTRADEILAYSILVNGQEVYFRTYEEASEGPNHYFVEVAASIAGSHGKISVTLRNYSETRVNFSRLWAYRDFSQLLASEDVGRKMTVGLFQPALKWDDYAADLQLVRQIKNEYAGMQMYKPGLGFDILYMHWNEEELHRRLDYLMNLSRDADLPIHLSINSWWGGTPSGPDGKGGQWTDIPYNQIVYDPLNADGRGNWKLSTPNLWSNTPWLSMNNEHYNQVRANKVKGIAQYISERTAEMTAGGDHIPAVVIFTENEPLYWPYYAFNASPEAGGDFSPETIAAAARDGVVLNPEDGLSSEEKLWMFNNLTTYISTVSRAIAKGYGYNAIVVNEGEIVYPDSQLVENAYTHMFPTPNYPNWDEKRAGWETHMVNDIRYGAEWAGDLDRRYLDYIVARGKYADVNAERSSIYNMNTLKQAYMYGADHVTLYNYQAGDRQLIDAVDGQHNAVVAVPAYDQSLMAYNFKAGDSLARNEILVDASGVRRDVLTEKYVATADNGTASGGHLTFKIDNGGAALASGLKVRVEGRALSELNADNRVEVWAGADEGSLTLATTLKNFSLEDVDVSDFINRNADVAYVQLKLFSPGLPESLYSWTSVWGFKAYVPWDKASGQSDGSAYTIDQMRERNLWVSYRADVERLLDIYQSKSGEDAAYASIRRLYQAAQYRTAYDQLTKELSQTLPAKYTVKGGGKLGKYPIELELADSGKIVDVVLYEAGDRVRLQLSAKENLEAAVTLSGLASGEYYKAVRGSDGVYTLSRTTAGDPLSVKAAGGKAGFDLTGDVASVKLYPNSFEAAYVSKNKDNNKPAPKGYLYLQSQDPAIGEYVNFVQVKLADDAIIARGADGAGDAEMEEVPLEMLNDGELLRITMNDNNEAVRIYAYYGQIYGTITDIQPISIRGELRNAAIEIDGQHRFEIGADAVFETPKATGGNILTADTDDLGFELGDKVTVTYSPYTYEGSPVRVLKITEVYDTLISESFETEDGDWKSRAFTADNIRIVPLDANYSVKVARPDNITQPGVLVWKLASGTPFTDLAIEYSGRAIMGNPDAQSVKWYVSVDQEQWTEVGRIEPGGDENNFTLIRSIPLHDEIANLTTLYVKCEIRTTQNDTWASLNDVKIKKKAAARELDSAAITLQDGALFTGQNIPIEISALYDNGDPVYLKEAKVAYAVGDKELAEVSGGVLKLLKPGATTVQAYVSAGGKIVKSNMLAVNIASNVLGGLNVSLPKQMIGVNEMLTIDSSAYNDQQVTMDPQQYTISYASSDESVAAVSSAGIVTGLRQGTVELTVTVSQGALSFERKAGNYRCPDSRRL
ncbi:S-layer homology domain-containing protein [Paenibacillus sp. GCM10027626]|uniref:S-layer homology domain-containing protein n=1 Tax=Paenibacillus sp. GCM10027626 TaxID=3273411 RepID=UPI0036356D2B